MNISDPFDFLQDLERRTIEGSADMPSLVQIEDEWVGVGFRVGSSKLIASMNDVKEILDLPEYTKVPGVKSWVIGVANVRGSLLPIMDLKSYLMGEDIQQRRKGRVIVVDYKGFDTGLVVEEVYGLRHFTENEATYDLPSLPESVSPYIKLAFEQDEEIWPVFSFDNLAQDERFTHASL